jgi:hypothetical protein
MGMRNLLFWLLVAATGVIYAAMAVWSLPYIAREAGGLLPFDLRPLGYSVGEAKAFLGKLTTEGRTLYLNVQHRLDLAFPALLAATLGWMAFCVPPPGRRAVRWAVAAFAIAGMVADYAENASVAAMLALPADAVPDALIASASRWTLAKSLGATVALSLGVVLVIRALLARIQAKQSMDSHS